MHQFFCDQTVEVLRANVAVSMASRPTPASVSAAFRPACTDRSTSSEGQTLVTPYYSVNAIWRSMLKRLRGLPRTAAWPRQLSSQQSGASQREPGAFIANLEGVICARTKPL